MSTKYPTFSPPPAPLPIASPTPVPPSKLAQAYSPIPIRHHYHHDDLGSGAGAGSNFSQQGQQSHSGFRGPQPPTPAPSPPPAPKPKKQQYQTDQTRPFLFPFSRSQRFGGRGQGSYVPFAIDEAEKLYNRHMYVSLALWQMWRTREECMTAESGLEHMPGSTISAFSTLSVADTEPIASADDVSDDPRGWKILSAGYRTMREHHACRT